jgi:D-glycero-alpha-D-manno-heptose-7-phosphate kinase
LNVKNVISLAPLRVSLVGGGTDFESFYSKTNGNVVSFALKKYVYVQIKRHDYLFHEKYRIVYSEIEKCNDKSEIKNSIIRSCLDYLNIDEPLYISISSDIPSNSGLGSSSSFTVALLLALHTLKGENVSKSQLANEACEVEISRMKSPIGKQDQFASAFGGINCFEFHGNGIVSIKPIVMNQINQQKFLNNSILIWSEITREANKILSDQESKQEYNFNNLLELNKLAIDLFSKMTSQNINVNEIAAQISAGWEIKKTLSPLVIDAKLEKLQETIEKTKTLGLKLLGAGGGGFFFVMYEDLNETVESKLKMFKYFKPEIDYEGARVLSIN